MIGILKFSRHVQEGVGAIYDQVSPVSGVRIPKVSFMFYTLALLMKISVFDLLIMGIYNTHHSA